MILLVEDDTNFRNMIKHIIKKTFDVEIEEASNGEDALSKIAKDKYSLYLIDINMPKMNGFELVKEIRNISSSPIIFITGHSSTDNKIKAHSHDVNWVIEKVPFSPEYIKGIIKKYINNFYKYKKLTINFDSFKVVVNNTELKLTKKEFEILELLIKNKNKIIEREKIINNIWGYSTVDKRTIDSHVKNLRSKLSEYSLCIVCKQSIGYKWEEEKII